MVGVVTIAFIAIVVLVSIAMSIVQFQTLTPLVFRCRKCGGAFCQPPYRRFPRVCPRCHAQDWAV